MPARLQSGQAAPRGGRRGRRDRRQYRRQAPARQQRQQTYKRYYRQQGVPQGQNVGRTINRKVQREQRHRVRVQQHRKRVVAKKQRIAAKQKRIDARYKGKRISPEGGAPGQFREAERFKRTAQYRSDIRAGIRAGTPERRTSALTVARRFPARVESKVALGEVKARRKRRELAKVVNAATPKRGGSKGRMKAQQDYARLMKDPENRRLLRRMQAQGRRAEKRLGNKPIQGTVAAGVKAKVGLGPAAISLPTNAAQIKGLAGALASPALAAGGTIGAIDIPGLGDANKVRDTLANISKNASAEVIDIPAQTPAGVYMAGRAGVKAARGDSKEAKKLWKDYKRSSAVALAVQGKGKEALKAFEKHPIATGLELGGVKGVIGRGTGAGLRRVEHPAGSTKRPALRVKGTNLEIGQSYSRDAITKANQIRKEKRAKRKGRDPFEATDRTGVVRGDIQSHVDRTIDRVEQTRRLHRDKALHSERKALKVKHREALPLIVERTLRKPSSVRDDLAKEHARLEKTLRREDLNHGQRRDAQAYLKTVKKLLADKDFLSNPGPTFEAAERFIERSRSRQSELAKSKIGLDEAQAERAALIPYAVKQMGAKYDRQRRIPDETEGEALYHGTALGADIRKGSGVIHLGTKGAAEQRLHVAAGHAGRDVMGSRVVRTRLKPGLRMTKPISEKTLIQRGHRHWFDQGYDVIRYVNDHENRGSISYVVKDRKNLTPETEYRYGIDHEPAATGGKRAPALVDATGRKLETAEIKAHLAANGVKPPGFFSQKPNMRGAKNFYINALGKKLKRNTIQSKVRTGESTRKGTYDIDPEVLVEQSIKDIGDVDAAKAFDGVIHQYGMRKKDGGYFRNWDEGQLAADDLREAGGPDLVPMRVGPVKEEHWAALKEDIDPQVMDQAIASKLSNAVAESLKEGDGKVVLVPKAVKARLLAHDLGPESKAFQQFTQGFKRAVLPFSPKWLFGNAFEITMRSAFYGLNPADYARGKRLVKRMEEKYPEAAEALRVQTTGGGHFAALGRQQIHQPLENMSKPRRGYEALRRTPVGLIPKGIRAAQDTIFALNSKLEAQPQYAALGKLAKRDAQEMRGYWNNALHVSDSALDDVAKGLVETKNQIRYARQLEEIFGLWGKRSPEARRWLINYTPFGQWAHNALKFVYITLPKKHPVKTGILAGIYEMTDEERRKIGLSLFADKPVRGYLQGSLPTGREKGIRWAGFTSFGVTADLPGFLEGQVLPQASVLPPLAGLDWKGDQLKDAKGNRITDPRVRALIGLNAQASAMIPLWSQAQRFKARGRYELPTSSLVAGKYPQGAKKVGVGSTFERMFSPGRTLELRREGQGVRGKKKKGGSVFSGSTSSSGSGKVFK